MWDTGATVSSQERPAFAGNSVLRDCKVSSCCDRLSLPNLQHAFFESLLRAILCLQVENSHWNGWWNKWAALWKSTDSFPQACVHIDVVCKVRVAAKNPNTIRHMHPTLPTLYNLFHKCSIYATLILIHDHSQRSIFFVFLLFFSC